MRTFSCKIHNNSLEQYFRTRAYQANKDGEMRFYIIREPDNNKIVLFFSLKCGIVFTTHVLDDNYRSLSTPEKEYVNSLIKALDCYNTSNGDNYLSLVKSGKKLFPENHSLLAEIANHRRNIKKTINQVNDKYNIISVNECFSSIEICHFCRCDDYSLDSRIHFPLGFGLFWQKIVPTIQKISDQIGCEFLYLFAADCSDNPDEQKLISYYENSLGFHPLNDEGVIILKPNYDDFCVGLLQRIGNLKTAQELAWNYFSDHVESLD